MQYLVIFTPKQKFETAGMPSDFWKLEHEEQGQAQDFYAKGCLRQVWALDTKNKGAVVLFEAESQNHLQKIIDRFPLVKVDYVDYQIFPLAPDSAFAKKS